ncbi:thiaminase/transcriptional activator TenA [Kineococcus xinjiangensis]|uniref:Aminopyrimidine aminohydrolase n=1 Tax=Kineococcus xinjiangensis TaxID=512762 RepID=A0A2S6IU58_9ACTN|nr:hypothetical protein [Kineococcus xinjiangensis]PPK97784.1 thiaminase/transcriptional activator TenA [Kineococcus xinjiangensis]
MTTLPEILSRTAPSWAAATQHPFLDAVREGDLPAAAFDTWLVQDHLFVTDLLHFQARLLARAPREARAVLAAGCVAVVEELAWFEEQAGSRSLDLAAAPLPATSAYAVLLQGLDAAGPDEALLALWALERVYLEAWTHASPSTAYGPFVEHWTTPGFAAYVAELEAVAAAAVTRLSADEAVRTVETVLRHEVDFWSMALPAVPAR